MTGRERISRHFINGLHRNDRQSRTAGSCRKQPGTAAKAAKRAQRGATIGQTRVLPKAAGIPKQWRTVEQALPVRDGGAAGSGLLRRHAPRSDTGGVSLGSKNARVLCRANLSRKSMVGIRYDSGSYPPVAVNIGKTLTLPNKVVAPSTMPARWHRDRRRPDNPTRLDRKRLEDCGVLWYYASA